MLCDGAMGTLLYDKGVFIHRCYDELNLSQPELVSSTHADYVRAGAEILETNTFGANRYRLAHFGFEARVAEINGAGVRLARGAAASDVLIAGSVGPLGERLAPAGPLAADDARAAFVEQIAALHAEGVDLLILETFGYLDELEQAILAARQAAPGVPLIASVTIGEDSHALDGSTPEEFAHRIEQFGADVVGLNCSVGPAAMLAVVERLRRTTKLPIAVQPNAGMPCIVEGRSIYMCSPEYMASFARKFIAAGASLVGGCCGTTPEHIKSMKNALRVGIARHLSDAAPANAIAHPEDPRPLSARSELGRKLEAGEFVTMVEVVPPRGCVPTKELAAARYLRDNGISTVNLPDSPRANARMSNQALCQLIRQDSGMETILHVTGRDRNVLGIQSDLLGAAALGLNDLICITGDPPKLGNYPDATAVFDVDSIGLVNIARNLNCGLDLAGSKLGAPTNFLIGVGANPGLHDIEEEIRRFELKCEAGAHFAVTQPVFDLRQLEFFIRRVEHCQVPIIAGIWPLTSLKNALFMRKQLRVAVPEEIVARMERADSNVETALAEGRKIAQEMLLAALPMIQGVQLSAPLGKFEAVVEIMQVLPHAASTANAR